MAVFNSPVPRILTGCLPFTIPAFFSTSGVISVSPSVASRSRFTTSYSSRKIFVKPRFGKRRCNGIWPPSNPRISLAPDRDHCPLCPRVEVLPMPEPMPRPTRFFFSVDFLGALIVDKFIWIPCFKVSEFQGFKFRPHILGLYFETLQL